MSEHTRNERRRPEASALRRLFGEQWSHLKELRSAWEQEREAELREQAELLQAIELMVDGTDQRMRVLMGYQNKLREAVGGLIAHIDKLVDQLPHPILVSARSFATDQNVNAFFAGKQDIAALFGRSRELRGFFRENPVSEAYCLLLMLHEEKMVLGTALVDGRIMRDVPQVTVNFYGHMVSAPSPDESALRTRVKHYLFENTVGFLKTHLTIITSMESPGTHSVKAEPERPGGPVTRTISDPGIYLERLQALLEMPRELIRLEHSRLRVNRMGIKIEDRHDTRDRVNVLALDELELGEKISQVMALVRFPRDEMPEPRSYPTRIL